MEIEKPVKAGRKGKADIEIHLNLYDKEKIEVNLESSVERLFGKHIVSNIKKYLSSLGVSSCKVSAVDDGALDFVIKSRLDAALYKNDTEVLEYISYDRKKKNIREFFFRRTRLYVPGNNPYLMENCGLFGADVIILDLEDAVAQNEKKDARFLVRKGLSELDFGNSEVIVRINPFSNGGEDDLKMVVPVLPDGIMLPKVGCAADVLKLDKIIQQMEKEEGISEGSIKIFPLIETAEGVVNSFKIAKASKRNVLLTFGAEDFTADMGIEKTKEAKELFFARSQVVLAAKAAGIGASDTVYSDFEDEQGLIEDTKVSKSLGFEGRGVIHPMQIEHIHKVYEPTEEEIEYAQKVVDALEEAKKSGSGVVSLGSKMIDAPVAKRAKRILRLAKEYEK
jgi:citrate lyase subunit beta/citryl-CoA lyase